MAKTRRLRSRGSKLKWFTNMIRPRKPITYSAILDTMGATTFSQADEVCDVAESGCRSCAPSVMLLPTRFKAKCAVNRRKPGHLGDGGLSAEQRIVATIRRCPWQATVRTIKISSLTGERKPSRRIICTFALVYIDEVMKARIVCSEGGYLARSKRKI